MPYGGSTPAQDVKIERCVNNILAKGIKPRKAGQSAKSAAIAVCKAQIMSNIDIEDYYFEIEGGENIEMDKNIEALMKHEGFTEDEAVLKYKQRQQLAGTAFCGPDRSYPAHDIAHARNALARVSQFGSPALQSRVRACVYRKFPELKARKQAENFTEDLTFSFKEGNIDEEKRTVRVCALATCVSKNGRFYSPTVVESASGTLTGKKSFADHDERTTKNLIGTIVGEDYDKGKLYADIRISRAKGIANQTWDKIKDGTITDVSIAADGKTRRAKLGEQIVDEVTELSIKSVDFVTEGGIADAKVMKYFEDINTIPKISEVKEEMLENIEQLKEKYPELVKELEDGVKKPLNDEIAKITKAKEAAEFKLVEKELNEFKETEIKKLELPDGAKNILREKVSGKTKEEITKKLGETVEFLKSVGEAMKGKAKIDGVPPPKNKEEKSKVWTLQKVQEDSRIPNEHRHIASQVLVEEGSERMLEYLKTHGVEIE